MFVLVSDFHSSDPEASKCSGVCVENVTESSIHVFRDAWFEILYINCPGDLSIFVKIQKNVFAKQLKSEGKTGSSFEREWLFGLQCLGVSEEERTPRARKARKADASETRNIFRTPHHFVSAFFFQAHARFPVR